LNTLVIEKSEFIGGVTGQSGGQVWLGAGPQELATDSIGETLAYIEALSVGQGDRAQQLSFARQSREAFQYYIEKCGLRIEAIAGLPDYYFPFAEGSKAEGRTYEPLPIEGRMLGAWRNRLVPSVTMFATSGDRLAACRGEDVLAQIRGRAERDLLCSGSALAAYFLRAAQDRKIDVRTSTAAVQLIREGGRVAGVIVERDASRQRIHARRGVVLATGGYDWNPGMVTEFDRLDDIKSMAIRTIEGDYVALAGEFGAAFTYNHAPERVLGCLQAGVSDSGESTYAYVPSGFPHCIVVNRRGERFCDESFAQDTRQALTEIDGGGLRRRNWPAWFIFDQQHLDLYGCAGLPKGVIPPERIAQQADNLMDLASRLGIDGNALEKTVARYNGFSDEGVDRDFGRGRFPYSNVFCGDLRNTPNANLGALRKPPFYGVRLVRLGTGFTNMGLVINQDAQVMDVRRRAISGLYAAGNCVGLSEFPVGYNSGMANMRGMLHGYLAGLHAATSVTEQRQAPKLATTSS